MRQSKHNGDASASNMKGASQVLSVKRSEGGGDGQM